MSEQDLERRVKELELKLVEMKVAQDRLRLDADIVASKLELERPPEDFNARRDSFNAKMVELKKSQAETQKMGIENDVARLTKEFEYLLKIQQQTIKRLMKIAYPETA